MLSLGIGVTSSVNIKQSKIHGHILIPISYTVPEKIRQMPIQINIVLVNWGRDRERQALIVDDLRNSLYAKITFAKS